MVETEGALKLVQELKINKMLPKFNDPLLKEVTNEITKTYLALTTQLTYLNLTLLLFLFSDPELDPEDDQNVGSLLVKQQLMNRNLRCCLAYM